MQNGLLCLENCFDLSFILMCLAHFQPSSFTVTYVCVLQSQTLFEEDANYAEDILKEIMWEV